MIDPNILCSGLLLFQRYPMLMSTYLGVMGRVLLQNTSFFSLLLNQMACELGQEVRMFVLVFQQDFMWKSRILLTWKKISLCFQCFFLPSTSMFPFSCFVPSPELLHQVLCVPSIFLKHLKKFYTISRFSSCCIPLWSL